MVRKLGHLLVLQRLVAVFGMLPPPVQAEERIYQPPHTRRWLDEPLEGGVLSPKLLLEGLHRLQPFRPVRDQEAAESFTDSAACSSAFSR